MKKIISLLFVLILLKTNQLSSQSLIAGIPNADVVNKNKFEFTHESQFSNSNNQFNWNSFNFLCYGIGNKAELTINLLNLNNEGNKNLSTAIGFKKYFTLYEDNLFDNRLTIGSNLLLGIPKQDFGYWAYGHFSSRYKPTKTRLTLGLSSGTQQMFGYRKVLTEQSTLQIKPNQPLSVMAGFEQNITPNFGIIGDWFSGNHELAALISGVQLSYHHQILIIAYKKSNNDINKDAVILEFMLNF
jgi:hypothetical protein